MAKGTGARKETKKPKKEKVKPGQTVSVASTKADVNINKTKT